ncbi:DUF2778 domain-containing protein [Rhizobium oryzicola]|uniref:DUF2778 domain-containing protein n=1 Tax=Rhizobium oryzicola TaxID=1232668 RepID=A0ABT8T1E4_9HYPH|nr:DUF2778 domain-containing protein [Rhizobium oryzicola]MDO1584472.1 DUF2778 domain-containing protein [Rhizobium oryzicola]
MALAFSTGMSVPSRSRRNGNAISRKAPIFTVSAVLGAGFAVGAWMIGAFATVQTMAPNQAAPMSLQARLGVVTQIQKPHLLASTSQADRLIRVNKFQRISGGPDNKSGRLEGAQFAQLAASRPHVDEVKSNVANALQEAELAKQTELFAALAAKRPATEQLKSTLSAALNDTVLVAPATQMAWNDQDDADDAADDGVQVAALETPAEAAVKQALGQAEDEGLPMAGPLPIRRPPANALAMAIAPSAERAQPAKPTQVAKPPVAAKDEDDEEDEKPTALAFARPENPIKSTARSVPWPDRGNGGTRIAVYDISAGVVHMPNGEKMEAHSGIGEMRDNPKFTHVKMRGPTPPGTYKLSMRESLFHGVAAIRLTPVDGRAPQGRTGLLAHSFLLRNRGDSHGCVAFADYPRFLKAFQRGEITHMVIVARHDGRIPAISVKSDGGSRNAESASDNGPRRTLVDYLKRDG